MEQKVLQVVLSLKDQLTDQLKSTSKDAESSFSNIRVAVGAAGAALTGIGVAGLGLMNQWTEAAAGAQVENAQFEASLHAVTATLGQHTITVQGNKDAIKQQSQAIETQIEKRQRQIRDLRDLDGDHKNEIKNLTKEIDGLRDQKRAIEDTTIVKDRLVTVTGKSTESFESLKQKIQDVSKAYVKLGFDDETTNNVMVQNLSVTKDMAEAQKLLGIEADLSRFKHIGLADAQQAVQMALMGSTKLLKQMGIEVDDNATKSEILAAIQQRTAGQAAAYAETEAGANERLKITYQNIQEELGNRLLPIKVKFINILSDLLDKFDSLSPAQQDMIVKFTMIATAVGLIGGPLLGLLAIIPNAVAGFNTLTTAVTAANTALGAGGLIATIGAASFALIGLGVWWKVVWDNADSDFKRNYTDINYLWKSLIANLQWGWATIKDNITSTDIWKTFRDNVAWAVNSVVDTWNRLVDSINRAKNAFTSFMSSGGGNGGRAFADGGWVAGTGPATVHDGEYVLSRDMLNGRNSIDPAVVRAIGGGNTTVNSSPVENKAINIGSINVSKEVDFRQVMKDLSWNLRYNTAL